MILIAEGLFGQTQHCCVEGVQVVTGFKAHDAGIAGMHNLLRIGLWLQHDQDAATRHVTDQRHGHLLDTGLWQFDLEYGSHHQVEGWFIHCGWPKV